MHGAVIMIGRRADRVFEHGEQQIILAREPLVKGAAGEPGPHQHRADRQSFEPGLAEQRIAGVDDLKRPFVQW